MPKKSRTTRKQLEPDGDIFTSGLIREGAQRRHLLGTSLSGFTSLEGFGGMAHDLLASSGVTVTQGSQALSGAHLQVPGGLGPPLSLHLPLLEAP